MQGQGRKLLQTVMSIVVMLALVTLGPTGTQAQRTPSPTPLPTNRVPEPSASVLLLLGISLTSLVGYGLKRRKSGE